MALFSSEESPSSEKRPRIAFPSGSKLISDVVFCFSYQEFDGIVVLLKGQRANSHHQVVFCFFSIKRLCMLISFVHQVLSSPHLMRSLTIHDSLKASHWVRRNIHVLRTYVPCQFWGDRPSRGGDAPQTLRNFIQHAGRVLLCVSNSHCFCGARFFSTYRPISIVLLFRFIFPCLIVAEGFRRHLSRGLKVLADRRGCLAGPTDAHPRSVRVCKWLWRPPRRFVARHQSSRAHRQGAPPSDAQCLANRRGPSCFCLPDRAFFIITSLNPLSYRILIIFHLKISFSDLNSTHEFCFR